MIAVSVYEILRIILEARGARLGEVPKLILKHGEDFHDHINHAAELRRRTLPGNAVFVAPGKLAVAGASLVSTRRPM